MGIASRDLDNVLLLGKKENEDECSGIWKVSGWDHLRSTATGSANLAVNVPLRTLLAVAGRGGNLLLWSLVTKTAPVTRSDFGMAGRVPSSPCQHCAETHLSTYPKTWTPSSTRHGKKLNGTRAPCFQRAKYNFGVPRSNRGCLQSFQS